MERFLWVCVGGAAGSGARYLVSGWVLRTLGNAFPYGTLAVNVVGSFLVGALMHVGLSSEALSPAMRLALITGAMGGFTTFSAFSYETLQLIQDGAWAHVALNVTITVAACLAASFLGIAVGRCWLGS
ncbi:MAG: fluoride efflux transporter CrcB [Polyangiaceae bacterium]|nr:fluoride efflux transporter CrcB [Polyangiaceae bacterium]